MRFFLPVFLFLLQPPDASAQALPRDLLISSDSDFRAALEAHLQPASRWVESLPGSFDFLCLGESHSNAHREQLAKLVLKKLSPKQLAVEATQDEAQSLLAEFKQSGKVKHLGADFSAVLAALGEEASLAGIEATQEEGKLASRERIKGGEVKLSRDGFIAQHAAALLEKGPVVALYGSLHCGAWSSGLGFSVPFFRLLKNKFSQKRHISVLLIPEQEPGNALRAFADSFGLLKEDVAIVNGKEIAPNLYNFRSDLNQLFRSYDVILLPRRTIPVDDSER